MSNKFSNVLNEHILTVSDTISITKTQVKNNETNEIYEPKIEITSLEERFINWVGKVKVAIPKKFSVSDFDLIVKAIRNWKE